MRHKGLMWGTLQLAVFTDTHRRAGSPPTCDQGLADPILAGMKSNFTAIAESAPEGGYWAICPDVPGANGQGEFVDEALESLRDAITLILEDRRADALRGLSSDAIQTTVSVP